MGEFIKHENEAVTYLSAPLNSVSLLLTSLPALVATGVMKYSSTVKNFYRHFFAMESFKTDDRHSDRHRS